MEEHLAGQKILTANNKPICDDHILSKLLKSKLGEDNVLSVMRQGGDFAVEVPNNFSQQKLEDIQISTPYLRRVKKTPTTDIIYIPDKAFHINLQNDAKFLQRMERLSKAGIAEERLSYFGRATDLIAVKGLKLTRFQQVAFADSGPYQRIQSIAENLGLAEKQITNQAQYEQTLTNIKNAYELDRLDHVTALPEMPKTYDEFKNLCDKFRPEINLLDKAGVDSNFSAARVMAKAAGGYVERNAARRTPLDRLVEHLSFLEKKVTSEEGFKNIVSTLKADPENYDYHGPVAELMPRNFAELKQVFKRYGAEMEAFAKTASKAENFIKL